MKTLFNEYGHFTGEIPKECVEDCTVPGQDASEAVVHWMEKLGFAVPRQKAIDYLAEFGAWPRESNEYDEGLNEMTDEELAEKTLWIACHDIKESGEWYGLIH